MPSRCVAPSFERVSNGLERMWPKARYLPIRGERGTRNYPHCLTPGSRFEHGTFQITFAFLTATVDYVRHVHTETLRFGIISAYEIDLVILETL